MHLAIEGKLPYEEKMNGHGKITYKIADGSVASEQSPLEKASYIEGTENIMARLHLADYAGYGL